MDNFWTDVADYVGRAAGAGARIFGPEEFNRFFSVLPPARAIWNIDDIDVLILHKGNHDQLSPQLLSRAFTTLPVGFANEVFIVLIRNPVVIEVDDKHIGSIDEVRMRVIEESDDTEPMRDSIIRRSRMPPCYVGNRRVLLESAFGHLMLVASEDTSITPHLVRDGWFDIDVTKFLSRTLSLGDTFVDVGANFGTYALVAADAVGKAGRVLAVEANPALAEMLHENLNMNGFSDRATVFRSAASHMLGTVELFVFSVRQGGSTVSPEVASQAEVDYGEKIVRHEVQSRTLDEIVATAGINNLSLIKIDVEGHEGAVLKGSINCIEQYRPKLLIEWHRSFLESSAEDELYDFLTQRLSYDLQRVEGGGATRPISRQELWSIPHSDILATPQH